MIDTFSDIIKAFQNLIWAEQARQRLNQIKLPIREIKKMKFYFDLNI